MNDIDDRLTRAGEQWRGASAPPPAIDIDRLASSRPARRWPWLALAGATGAAVLVVAVWRGLVPVSIGPGASATPGASSTQPVAAASPGPAGSPTPRPSYPPGVGAIHVEAQPASLSYAVEVSFGAPGGPHDDVVFFEPGFAITVDRTFLPGPITIHVNGAPCPSGVDVLADVELDLVLKIAPERSGGCELYGYLSHALGGVSHPMQGAIIGAVVWEGATVRIRSLDPAHVLDPPFEVVAGPTGFEGVEFPIGPYEVSAILDGELLTSDVIDLTADGGGLVVNLMALPRDVPRDCAAFDAELCERAIRAALAYSQSMGTVDRVKGVRVRKSVYMSCAAPIEPPLYDVVFQMVDGEIDRTVGTLASGRLVECTY